MPAAVARTQLEGLGQPDRPALHWRSWCKPRSTPPFDARARRAGRLRGASGRRYWRCCRYRRPKTSRTRVSVRRNRRAHAPSAPEWCNVFAISRRFTVRGRRGLKAHRLHCQTLPPARARESSNETQAHHGNRKRLGDSHREVARSQSTSCSPATDQNAPNSAQRSDSGTSSEFPTSTPRPSRSTSGATIVTLSGPDQLMLAPRRR
jgi:hypothetical protein